MDGTAIVITVSTVINLGLWFSIFRMMMNLNDEINELKTRMVLLEKSWGVKA